MEEKPARSKLITDSGRVRDIMSKFSSKYGDVRKYYPKPDVAEVQLLQILSETDYIRWRPNLEYNKKNRSESPWIVTVI